MLLFFKNLLFTVLVPGTVAVLLPYWMGSQQRGTLPWSPPSHWAILPFAAGAAIYFRCVWDFAVTGRGTPAPIDAPKVLIVRGLYRYVRNPIYIGVLLVVLGWTIYFASRRLLLYALVLAVLFHLFVALIEEPSLRRQFGRSYDDYCGSVRRWLPGKPYALHGD